jgi:peroxiredoxin Q/BCP
MRNAARRFGQGGLVAGLTLAVAGCGTSGGQTGQDGGAARRPTAGPGTAAGVTSPAEVEQAASRSSAAAGRPAPDFTLPDQDGRPVRLADRRGKWVVLYIYPKDDTPGCTCQATEFTKLLGEFRDMNADVLGVSGDSPADHRYFRQKYDLALTLLSDPAGEVMRRYGAWVETPAAGPGTGRTVRQTYLIGPDGTIARHWPEVIPEGHAERVRQALAGVAKAPATRPTARVDPDAR